MAKYGVREDSQINFATGNVFWHVKGGGGFTLKNVSQILAIIDFSSGQIAGKTLPVRKSFIGIITLDQTSHLNLDKFGIGNDIKGCQSAPFT